MTRYVSGHQLPGAGHVSGFTLIELMVTIAIAAILATLAIPSFKEVINNSRLKSHSTAFYSSLLLARSEAIKRNGRVVLCKSADGATCTTTGNWQQGWLIFADASNNGTRETSEAVIQKVAALSGDFVLKGNEKVVNYVSYSSTGATKFKGSEAFQAGTFTLCQRAVSNGQSRSILISATGRPKTKPETAATCAD